jgi:hypothetical protein
VTEKEHSDYRLLQEQIKHLREIRELDQDALKLQRSETDRRLNNLNGEHENIKQNQAKSVLREVYTSEQDGQNKKIEELLNWKSNSEGRQAVAKYIAIVSAVISTISLVLWVIKMFGK